MKKNLFFLIILFVVQFGCTTKKQVSMNANEAPIDHRQLTAKEADYYAKMLNQSNWAIMLFIPQFWDELVNLPVPQEKAQKTDFSQKLAEPWEEFAVEKGIEPPVYGLPDKGLEWDVAEAEAVLPDPTMLSARAPSCACFSTLPQSDSTLVWKYDLPTEKFKLIRAIDYENGLIQVIWVTNKEFYWIILPKDHFSIRGNGRNLLNAVDERGGLFELSNGKIISIVFENGDDILFEDE